MNMLYIHGLDSKLSPEKREILERFGEVYAPDLNYYNNPHAIETILQKCRERELDAVIGSSMGGFAGFYVATALNLPTLLFNPALKKRSVAQEIPTLNNDVQAFKQIILGKDDEVVDPHDTLQFLKEDPGVTNTVSVQIVPGLGHNIPLDIFEEKVREFHKKIKVE